jgi:hypothetical protein
MHAQIAQQFRKSRFRLTALPRRRLPSLRTDNLRNNSEVVRLAGQIGVGVRNEILGNYGLVRILSGKHKGEMGYYDNEHERGRAIVYLEGSELLSADYVIISFRALERIEISSLEVERFKREHPSLAKAAGIR